MGPTPAQRRSAPQLPASDPIEQRAGQVGPDPRAEVVDGAQAPLQETELALQVLIADINNDIHGRVLRLLMAELAAVGKGPPPVPFACIVMGSGGRGESLLFPDQDHFVLADYPDAQHGEIDPWFIELASRLSMALDRLHFPLCGGGVMATNPVWRKTLPQWRRQATLWMRGWVPATLLFCEIFFDFRCAYGECALAQDLRAFVTSSVSVFGSTKLPTGVPAR